MKKRLISLFLAMTMVAGWWQVAAAKKKRQIHLVEMMVLLN